MKHQIMTVILDAEKLIIAFLQKLRGEGSALIINALPP